MSSGQRQAAAAILAAAAATWGAPAWAQGAPAGHSMPGMSMPAATSSPSPNTTVNLGAGSGAGNGAGIVHSGHEVLSGAVLIDQLEFRGNGRDASAAWEGQAYYGSDYNKVWINTRGEYSGRERAFERAELQLLYSRLIGYFFDAQVGVRQDFPIRPRQGTPARTHLVMGLQGLLPNLFELNLQGFVNHRGTLAARVEASYDAYITQRLVLQPRVELNFAANADRPARVGKGLTNIETGLRLRYEITREVSPYVGISYERAVGETSTLYQRFGEKPEATTVAAGIRLFF